MGFSYEKVTGDDAAWRGIARADCGDQGDARIDDAALAFAARHEARENVEKARRILDRAKKGLDEARKAEALAHQRWKAASAACEG